MRLYKHKDYDEYVKAQVAMNEWKIENIWVEEEEIDEIVAHIRANIKPKNGICHGTRNGWEITKFRDKLGIEVIGTEISTTAQEYPHTIQWDFHEIKDEWVDNIDFIYSNSFDHSYDPIKCLDQWMKCIKKGGVCYIHWESENTQVMNVADCFSASENEFRSIFNRKYDLVDELGKKHRTIFAIKHKIV